MRIGLLGGTFNPIHRCHLRIAHHAQQALELDQILFIPSGDPPHKSQHVLVPAHHRLEMVRRAISAYPSFAVSEIEIHTPHKSYTINTIEALQQERPGDHLWFLVGLDAFCDFPTWKEAKALLHMVNIVVLSRPPYFFAQLAALPLLPPLPTTQLEALDTGSLTRLEIPLSPHTTLTLLRIPPCQISASAIRKRLQAGLSVADWLPPSVESYIMQFNLYQSKKGGG
ncbi:MAG: nicotinate (nicotinamide) nucleotide adenylyltransferase [Nitrospirae bacterium]|nr:MAG: nicotinate (nicotinamide) nucleotide adenylyltransferase [Nitrospirota bacterium]